MRSHRTPVFLFVAFLLLRIPFRSQFLVNWDAVNFALGTHAFDLVHHQPHPPGYIGYVAVGWLLNHLTGDANASLSLLSVVSTAAAPVGFFFLASLFMRRGYALASAVLFGLSPVVWYYGEVALTYSVGLALALFCLWTGYLGRQRASGRLVLTATLLLVLLGAVRPTGGLFLMPVWLYVVWSLPWRSRLSMTAVLVGGNLLWLVPLLWLSGGVATFLQLSRELAALVVMPTSVFGAGAQGPGPGQNIAFLSFGVLVGANLGLLLIVAGLLANRRAFSVFADHRVFLLLWLAPPSLTYMLVHTGQLGYVLLILPAFFLLMGVAMEGIAVRWRSATVSPGAGDGRREGDGRRAGGGLASAGATTLLAAGNVAVFFLLPQLLLRVVPRAGPEAPRERPAAVASLHWLTTLLRGAGVGANPRQFHLPTNDRHWRALIEFARKHPPARSAILTAPNGRGSFRHLTYYLPRFRTYGLGWDMEGRFGHLFTAYGGTSDYSPRSLRNARGELLLPPRVTTLLVPDRAIQTRMRAIDSTDAVLDRGLRVMVVSVPPHTRIVIEDPTDRDAAIRVAPASKK